MLRVISGFFVQHSSIYAQCVRQIFVHYCITKLILIKQFYYNPKTRQRISLWLWLLSLFANITCQTPMVKLLWSLRVPYSVILYVHIHWVFWQFFINCSFSTSGFSLSYLPVELWYGATILDKCINCIPHTHIATLLKTRPPSPAEVEWLSSCIILIWK